MTCMEKLKKCLILMYKPEQEAVGTWISPPASENKIRLRNKAPVVSSVLTHSPVIYCFKGHIIPHVSVVWHNQSLWLHIESGRTKGHQIVPLPQSTPLRWRTSLLNQRSVFSLGAQTMQVEDRTGRSLMVLQQLSANKTAHSQGSMINWSTDIFIRSEVEV